MSNYSTLSDVEGLCAGLMDAIGDGGKFSDETLITKTQVQTWLDNTESVLNQYLKSAGCAAPYSSSSTQASVLEDIITSRVTGKVYEAYSRIAGKDEFSHTDIESTFKEILVDISTNPQKWKALLDGKENGVSFKSHVTSGSSKVNLRGRLLDINKNGILW